MKPKSFIIGLLVVLVGGLGIYAYVKFHGSGSTADNGDEESTPSIVSVQTGTLQRMTLHHYVTGYGTVVPAPATADTPAASSDLAAPVAGVVAKVEVVEGQQVKKGEVLMELNSGSTTFALAEQELKRQKELYEQHNTSLRNLQNAEAQLALLRVTSPLAGTVVSVNVQPGSAVDASTVVARVVDMNRLVVQTDIPAPEASELKPGQEMQVLTQPPVTATLSFVSPTVDTNNNTVTVRAALPSDSGLHPGEFTALRIVTAVHTNCLSAPEASVVTDINGQSVIALVNGEEATQTPVQTGFREDNWVEVAGNGLKDGDYVVTVGAYGLPKTTKIQVINPSGKETPAANSAAAQ